jgi:signal transduction histidine kinase
VFEPFFTTKGVGEGTGLGLDTVQRIVKKHQGTIQVDSKPGDTVFQVWLPLSNTPA